MRLHRLTKIQLSIRVLVLLISTQIFACSSNTEGSRNVTLKWIAPSEREDGTPLSLSEIAGYRIYYGPEPADYPHHIDINDSTAEQVSLDSVPSGFFLVMTTIDTAGSESTFSKVISVSAQ